MLDTIFENVVFTQQCFVLSINNSIILGSDFLDTYFAMLNTDKCIITLNCPDYILTTSLTQDSV